ncbi:hypothetical protein ABF162_18100 [Vibrio coralliilyticus]|uniref:hypothetical protein n=1 Tax=Vibrio coralliilyticus TaxID=190893 RepID=UPI0005126CAF|nr:hypothetical protein [Vibrio coralliilyticus]AIS57297.1 hypothetical protein JV59_19960 [Vibrio coralliilyticus]
MDLQQCWTHYLKAEQLLEQGHWPEAHYLYDQVLHHLPTHIQSALSDDQTKPCQFSCLLTGLRDAAVSQSEILNKMGQHQNAFDLLNQSYALLQFMSIESAELVQATHHVLDKNCEDLLRHMGAFCSAQRNAQWMLEFEQVQKAHHHFSALKSYGNATESSHQIN